MSIECAECERDLRGGHDPSCSRYKPQPKERQMAMPEKIGRFDYGRGDVRYTTHPLFISGQTPYVRADLVDDLRKALEDARESLEIFADCVSDHTQIRQDISDDLAKIDAALTRIKRQKET